MYDGRSQPREQSGFKSCTPRQSTINMHFGLAPLCENEGLAEVNKSADLTSAFLFAPQYTEDGFTSHMRMPADIKSLYGQRNSPKRFEILFSNWVTREASLIRSTVDRTPVCIIRRLESFGFCSSWTTVTLGDVPKNLLHLRFCLKRDGEPSSPNATFISTP